jgi:hypothetical protein
MPLQHLLTISILQNPKKGLYPTDDIGYFGWVQGKAGEYSSQASVGL